METLIPVINKLQDVFNVIGADVIQLPQIVVVGTQSSGKSSLIESIVGRSFLPRGTGIITRCPLVLQLHHRPKDDLRNRTVEDGTHGLSEWATFLHRKGRVFTDFDEIRSEIECETSIKAGNNKGICCEPIVLKIFSTTVVNLTLVDLPGITKVPVGDQPEDIEQQVRNLILKYIGNPNALILAVITANTDMATNESIKIAKEVDASGRRTLAVLTKLDLMDAGTDATDILCGRVVPIKLGIIGVVNRSQKDINDKKTIGESLKDEAGFLQRTYPKLAGHNGTPYLVKTLSRMLMHHIKECLPDLKARVGTLVGQYTSVSNVYGEKITDKGKALLQMITKFSLDYCSAIDGTSKLIETSELMGGARISYIFHRTFGGVLDRIDPLSGMSKADILTAIRNSTGPRPALFLPEAAFELLVKRQIRRLEEPSLRCVELVHDEMQRIVKRYGVDRHKDVSRFPRLYENVTGVVKRLLQKCLPTTNEKVKNLIAMELAYINTKHPDFCGEAEVVTSLLCSLDGGSKNALQIFRATSQSSTETLPNHDRGDYEPVRSSVKKTRKPTLKELYEQGLNMENGMPDDGSSESAARCHVDISGVAASSSRTSLEERYATPDAFSPDGSSKRKLTDGELRDCYVIETLIKSYFFIVRKTIQDTVPKVIMHFMVNRVKQSLQSELVTNLYQSDKIDHLLFESPHIAEQRNQAEEMLKALRNAQTIISEIGQIKL